MKAAHIDLPFFQNSKVKILLNCIPFGDKTTGNKISYVKNIVTSESVFIITFEDEESDLFLTFRILASKADN